MSGRLKYKHKDEEINTLIFLPNLANSLLTFKILAVLLILLYHVI